MKITSPFEIEITFKEFDGYLPSVQVILKCTLYEFQKKSVEICNNGWIAREQWMKFISDIAQINTLASTLITLHDLSDNPLISIERVEATTFLYFSHHVVDISGVESDCKIKSIISDADLSFLVQKLNDMLLEL